MVKRGNNPNRGFTNKTEKGRFKIHLNAAKIARGLMPNIPLETQASWTMKIHDIINHRERDPRAADTHKLIDTLLDQRKTDKEIEQQVKQLWDEKREEYREFYDRQLKDAIRDDIAEGSPKIRQINSMLQIGGRTRLN